MDTLSQVDRVLHDVHSVSTLVGKKLGGLYMQQQYSDLLIDVLLDEGFTVEESEKLIKLQEKYHEQRANQANEETNYHRFIRWMVEHGRISDW